MPIDDLLDLLFAHFDKKLSTIVTGILQENLWKTLRICG